VYSVAFSSDGTRIVTGGFDNPAKVWDARTGDELKGEPIPQTITNNQISPDGRFFAHPYGSHVELVPVQPDEEELSYRRLHTQPNVWRYREGYEAARAAQDDFAARFYLNLLPPPEQKILKAQADTERARLYQQQGNWAAAKRLLLEAGPNLLAALKANPRNPTYRQFYGKHLSALIAVHAGLLEQPDAVRTAETCRDLGWNAPMDAYDAACYLSLCIPIVAKHDKLDDNQRKEAAQFYGDAAMKILREAVSKGWKNVRHMKKDTDLDPLRQREDYKKLIAELETSPDPGVIR